MGNILEVGEKVHIVERRYFENDPRRHFIGEIMQCEGNIIRAKGNAWIFDGRSNEFIKRTELRERVIVLGERLTINVIPKEVILDDVKYVHKEPIGLFVTDGKEFSLAITEFSARR